MSFEYSISEDPGEEESSRRGESAVKREVSERYAAIKPRGEEVEKWMAEDLLNLHDIEGFLKRKMAGTRK